ncbi:Alcohol dehydrogenase, class IV [Desulfatibacillum alkenivorans DSM 16219]|jgi:alcohol dehydrogenase class IV|uniref:Alcohol dehydrogenase, class IV n=1 Tax=Desulfatibacillum alkenivorans DSM 16219 TaxID=1121393 RepID=A0A1M7B1F6_9BACT|nr:alcohol dehydrogenase-like regulatory protein ErcA [Desulfatibacillum alkenivorans]SHL48717.1 Alcohol dehydrogenase, class IV [Desulfatibacillum alkenivorans DSM 16219]
MELDVLNLRKFVAPEIVFGNGSRKLAGQYARLYGAGKVFLVTDPGIIETGWVQDVIASLEAAGLSYVMFSDVSPNPRTFQVMQGAEEYLANKCKLIVAVGGGSPMDCAKAIGIVVTNGKHIVEFEGVDMIPVPAPPLILIPTTAGSSADVSQFCIISDQDRLLKMAIVSKTMVPDVALIDPETTHSMDAYLTACTGVDALVHAIEAFVSMGSGPLTDPHALDAIRLIGEHLPSLVNNLQNVELREKIMLASMKAGLAFSNAILGAVHAMSHSLGGRLDLPHGECNAILLDQVMEYNFPHAEDKFRVIAEHLGIDCRGMTTSSLKNALLQKVRDLKKEVGIAKRLGDTGVKTTDIPSLAANAIKDACMATNPVKANQRDIEVIYEESL